MKKIFRVMLSLVLVLALLPVGTVSASDGDSPQADDQIIYFSSKTSSSRWGSLSIGGGVDAYKISNVKSSKTSVLEVTSSRGSKTTYTETDLRTGEKTTGTDGYAFINYQIKKPGSAVISYKVGKKTYKTKVTAKKYVNPCASIKIPGVNSGKNFASDFANANYNSSDLKISKSIKTFPKITVKARSGWEITGIYLSKSSYANDDHEGSSISYDFNPGVSSKSVYLGPFKSGKKYYLSVSFRNKKDGGSISVSTNLS